MLGRQVWLNQQSISSVMALVTHSAYLISSQQAGVEEQSGIGNAVAIQQLGHLLP